MSEELGGKCPPATLGLLRGNNFWSDVDLNFFYFVRMPENVVNEMLISLVPGGRAPFGQRREMRRKKNEDEQRRNVKRQ